MNKFINWLKLKYKLWKLKNEIFSDQSYNSNSSFGNPFFNNVAIDDSFYLQQENEMKYIEGLYQIKSYINSKAKTKEEYEKVLSKYGSKEMKDNWKQDIYEDDLIDLADNNSSDIHKIMKQFYTRDKKDIKNNKQKKQMIDKRIKDYEKLQITKQIRKLNKQLRKAESNGDAEMAKELRSKINELGRSI